MEGTLIYVQEIKKYMSKNKNIMTRNETERQGDKSGKTASLPDTKHLAVPLSPCIQVVALVLFLPSTAGGVQLVLPKTADIPKEKVRNT